MNPGDSRTAINRNLLALTLALYCTHSTAEHTYSAHAGHEHPNTVYWGDTHLHTSLSVDAYVFGNRIDPIDAYRFARGETILASNGMRVRLRRPLDFLVIADHAESLGVMTAFAETDATLLETERGRRLLQLFEDSSSKQPIDPKRIEDLWVVGLEVFGPWFGRRLDVEEKFARTGWSRVIAAAEQYNEPGRFTAFIGYEWTQNLKATLHRVVVFKDGATKAKKVMPFSSEDGTDPEALWAYLERYEREAGGEALAIPHNANLSDGQMFSMLDFSGRPFSRSYAEVRSRWEPLYEVAQTKGYSEAHPFLSPTDEFAAAEIWNGRSRNSLPAGKDSAEAARKEGEYARAALKRGLSAQAQLGVNPFKFGLIASTDAHTSLPAVDEQDFWGVTSVTEPGPDRLRLDRLTAAAPLEVARELARRQNGPEPTGRPWHMASSGYAAVWATENTREAVFAAMKRKETYATTGPRMMVRFFGGWDYSAADAFRSDLAAIGYRKGIPMGGDLTDAPAGKAPRFLVRAVKDPDGANLDRVQVIKGWRDARGELHERIYNVALADGRKAGSNGEAAPIGSTVDVVNATYTNSIGDPELAVVWTDPHFDPSQLAFYYVRVLEIPTPRWTAYDAKFFGIKDIPPDAQMITQERAYTSPIWYTPQPEQSQGDSIRR